MTVKLFNYGLVEHVLPMMAVGAFGEAFLASSQHVNVIFVDGDEIKRLNKKFRGKDEETDVLSFNVNEDVLGEVYVCPDYLAKEKRFTTEEVVRMIVHGILHLQGYDHVGYFDNSENITGDDVMIDGRTHREVERMFIEQEKLVKKLLAAMKK